MSANNRDLLKRDYTIRTMPQVAAIMGITKQGVRHLELTAFRKIRRSLSLHTLEQLRRGEDELIRMEEMYL